MSWKRFYKYKDHNMTSSELDRPSAAGGLTRIPQRNWINTWSFNLHNKIPIENVKSKEQPKLTKMLRKYYGKKILYVAKPQEAHAIVFRSKLLKSVQSERKLSKRI